jgi:glycolate oxidase FAD binding subunit
MGNFGHIDSTSAVNNEPILDISIPTTIAELADRVTIAHRDVTPILVAGNGTKLAWGQPITLATQILSTQKLDRLIAHAVGDLTVTVEAGMTLEQLQATLATAGQFLPLDPAYPEAATIGGLIATADTGSYRHRYGGVRDLLLGISFVRADGKIAKAGGRVVKNVAGYDMMKLFTGSYGTLGILTEVTLRVYPLPPATGTVSLTGALDRLCEVAKILLASTLTPTAVDVVSGAFSQALEIGTAPTLLVKFATLPESVAQQSEQLLAIATRLGVTGEILPTPISEQIWSQIQTGIWGTAPIGCKLGARPNTAIETIATFDRLTNNTDRAIVHISSGIGACSLSSPDPIDPLRRHCEASGGFLSVLQAPVMLKQQIDVWGYRGNAVPLMRSIEHQFDPLGILNPGKCF